MNIGIDFDNTIAQYVTSFREVALEEGIIDGNWECKGKTELRDHLRHQPNGEKIWMKLQGLVYGKYMNHAEMLPAVPALAEQQLNRYCFANKSDPSNHQIVTLVSILSETHSIT